MIKYYSSPTEAVDDLAANRVQLAIVCVPCDDMSSTPSKGRGDWTRSSIFARASILEVKVTTHLCPESSVIEVRLGELPERRDYLRKRSEELVSFLEKDMFSIHHARYGGKAELLRLVKQLRAELRRSP